MGSGLSCLWEWRPPSPEEEHSLFWIEGGGGGGPLPLEIESEINFTPSDSSEETDEDPVEECDLSPPGDWGSPPPEEERLIAHAPPFWREGGGGGGSRRRKKLTGQLSMLETAGELAWERRRRQQIEIEEERKNGKRRQYLTDGDLRELRGCIELGFRFEEDQGGKELCKTLPALDLYFAVKRQFSNYSISPLPSPNTPATKSSSDNSTSSPSLGERSSSFGSIMSDSDSLKIFGPPGDDPEQVKTRLRHWAQAVACSVLESHIDRRHSEY